MNAALLADNLNGIQLCKLLQKDFVDRCLPTPDVGREQAVVFCQKLWRLQIDFRQQPSQSGKAQKADPVQEEKKKTLEPPSQTRIMPGMFVRLALGGRNLEPPHTSFNGIDTVMIMSPAGSENFDQRREDRRFVSGLVGPSIMTDAYELFVEKTEVYAFGDTVKEVLMEYL